MLFMIIEQFRDNDMLPIYKQVRDGGRMLPERLKYIDSWVEPNFSRCFQLMECDDLRLLQECHLRPLFPLDIRARAVDRTPATRNATNGWIVSGDSRSGRRDRQLDALVCAARAV